MKINRALTAGASTAVLIGAAFGGSTALAWEDQVRDRVAEAFEGVSTQAARESLGVLGVTEPEHLLPLLRTVDLARFGVTDTELLLLNLIGVDREDVLTVAADEFLNPTR